MIVGDFNAHHPLWGSNKVIEKAKLSKMHVLSNLNLCILNDGSNTYLHPGNGSYSSIDLTIVDPLLLDFHWTVHCDLCGSYHCPIIVKGWDPLKMIVQKLIWKLKND